MNYLIRYFQKVKSLFGFVSFVILELKSSYNLFIVRKYYFKVYKANVHKLAIIKLDNLSNLHIGKNTSIGAYSLIYSFEIDNEKRGSLLSIGEGTYIGEFNNVRACGGKVTIGNYCLISQFVSIIASNHSINKNEYIIKQKSSTEKNFVVIDDDVWIGANCTILPGAIIGRGSIIAAGSVVRNKIPPYSIAGGVPARIIKTRE